MKDVRTALKGYFSLNGYLIPQHEAEQIIREGVSFRGTNILILVFAILIASLGLNTNSTAVIIGAMLISPLMGPIIGLGLGVGIEDFDLLKRSFRNLSVAAAFSVLASTMYFLISPVSEGHSELLARTSPTIYDVLIGVNLLREGLDLPQVSLVAILDADKEGFLRNHRSLTQTAGRAARNVHGKVIMYADKITDSMQRTIDETYRRRKKQMQYNEEHGITPTPIVKKSGNDLIEIYESSEKKNDNGRKTSKVYVSSKDNKAKVNPRPYYEEEHRVDVAADPVIGYMAPDELSVQIEKLNARMVAAAKRTDFIEAAQLRDEMLKLKDRLDSINSGNN